jgi:hypothetical protein
MRTAARTAWSATATLACMLAFWPAVAARGATAAPLRFPAGQPSAALLARGAGRPRYHAPVRPLILSQSGVSMRLPSFRLDGRRHQFVVVIHPMQVSDERSLSAGWQLRASLSQFSGVAGAGAFRARAVVVPQCAWTGGSQQQAVTARPATSLGTGAVVLCTAGPLNGGAGASRLFAVSATLTVTIPAYVPAGRYSAIVTFTLLDKTAA